MTTKIYKATDVLRAGMEIFDMTPQRLRNTKYGARGSLWCEARSAIWLALYELAGMRQSEIADLCGRERSTISTGITKYHKDHSRHDIDGWLELGRTCVKETAS